LVSAGTRTAAATLESASRRAGISLRVFDAALSYLRAGKTTSTPRLLGADFTETGLRAGMERCYRALAHETPEIWERIALVEKANNIRPRTRL
jgi:serine/threonine-protein kinase PknG